MSASKLIPAGAAVAALALLAGCGSHNAAAPTLGGSSTCKSFMSATEADQNQAVNKVATQLRTPNAVTPLGRPEVNYLCAANPDMKLSAAVAKAGGKDPGTDSSSGAATTSANLDRAGLLAATKAALAKTLSYDYRSLYADETAATALMTPDFAKTYTKDLEGIRSTATKASAVVTDTTLATAVLGISKDTGCVLSFDNQQTTKADGAPTTFQNTIAASMVLRDGTWLLSNIESGANSTCPDASEPDPAWSAPRDAAKDFASALGTFSPATLGGYQGRVTAVTTPKQAAEFKKSYAAVEQGIQAKGMSSKVDAIVAGTASVDANKATVLVATDESVTYSGGNSARHQRWSVDLVKVDGKWLVDNFAPVS